MGIRLENRLPKKTDKLTRTRALCFAIFLVSFVGCNSAVQSQRDWKRATPKEVAMDSTLIRDLLDHAREDRFPNLHSIVVVKDGCLIVDEYFGDFRANQKQFTASVSKSVGSILLGIAIEQGLLPSLSDGVLDMPLAELFPEYKGVLTREPAKSSIQLRHVLSMSAGFEWDEQSFPYNDERNDCFRVSHSRDPAKLVLERPITAPAGTAFNYNGGLSILMSHLVQRITGKPADEFAKQHLFDPLGITDYEWERLPNGLTDTDGGLHLRPCDMARIGQLYLDGGVWNGKRLVSREWVDESTRTHIQNSGAPNYGFQWWCGDFHYQARSTNLYMASGHGGQKIFVIPEYNMVVVLTHEVFDNPMGELRNTAIMSRYVLPAVDPKVKPKPMPSNIGLSRFTGTYELSSDVFQIELLQGVLHASSENIPEMELVPVSESRFRGVVLDLLDVDFVFDIQEDGRIKGGRVTHGFSDESFVRRPDSSN